MTRLRILITAIGVMATVGLSAREPDTAAVLRMFSYHGFAHGCPISPTTLLTARHVATLDLNGGVRGIPHVWTNGHGESGSAWLQDYDVRRDLAVMTLAPPVTHWYQRATEPPVVGERVTILGYNLKGDLEPLALRMKVKRIVAQHLILSEPALPGFSGSCVLNSRNEVVAIFHWSLSPPGSAPTRGGASGVWGTWGFVNWLPPPA